MGILKFLKERRGRVSGMEIFIVCVMAVLIFVIGYGVTVNGGLNVVSSGSTQSYNSTTLNPIPPDETYARGELKKFGYTFKGLEHETKYYLVNDVCPQAQPPYTAAFRYYAESNADEFTVVQLCCGGGTKKDDLLTPGQKIVIPRFCAII